LSWIDVRFLKGRILTTTQKFGLNENRSFFSMKKLTRFYKEYKIFYKAKNLQQFTEDSAQ